MFSLAGIPPLAGFWAKWYVFLAAIDAKLYALAVIGVLASVVGAYYYLRIIKIMWFDEPVGGFQPMAGELRVVLGAVRRVRAVLRADRRPDRRDGGSRRQDVLLNGVAIAVAGRLDGYRLEAHGDGRLDQRVAPRARARRRSRQAVGRGEAPGERARPPRPRLGDAAGNLLPASLLVDPAPSLPATSASLPGWRCRCAAAVPPGASASASMAGRADGRWRAEMAERRAWPTAPSSPASCWNPRGSPAAARVAIGIGVNVVAHPDEPALSRDVALPRCGVACRCRDAVPGAVRRLDRRRWRLGRRPRACRDPRRWLARAARPRRACRGQRRRQCGARRVRDASTRTAAS